MNIKDRFIENREYNLLLYYFGEQEFLRLYAEFHNAGNYSECDEMQRVAKRPHCTDVENVIK